jgi:hypothetical protein
MAHPSMADMNDLRRVTLARVPMRAAQPRQYVDAKGTYPRT